MPCTTVDEPPRFDQTEVRRRASLQCTYNSRRYVGTSLSKAVRSPPGQQPATPTQAARPPSCRIRPKRSSYAPWPRPVTPQECGSTICSSVPWTPRRRPPSTRSMGALLMRPDVPSRPPTPTRRPPSCSSTNLGEEEGAPRPQCPHPDAIAPPVAPREQSGDPSGSADPIPGASLHGRSRAHRPRSLIPYLSRMTLRIER